MREIGSNDIADIALGGAILGSGGGGNVYMGRLIAERILTQYGPMLLTEVIEVPADAVVVPVAVMGAPTVYLERVYSGDEALRAFYALNAATGLTPTHIMPAMIGGVNGTDAIPLAAITALPLVDADLVGRAFPELQMILPTLTNSLNSPFAIADDKGNVVTLQPRDNLWGEQLARACCVVMGGTAGLAFTPIRGDELTRVCIPGSVTTAQKLGRVVRDARAVHADPLEAIRAALGGRTVLRGKIVDVERKLDGGFIRGRVTIQSRINSHTGLLTIDFQNEFLVVSQDKAPIATTPDLICVIEEGTGEALTSDLVQYGMRVAVVVAPSDERWRTPEGLAVVGPRYFGYDCDFRPIERSENT